jgi:hypothetical protein
LLSPFSLAALLSGTNAHHGKNFRGGISPRSSLKSRIFGGGERCGLSIV